MNKEEAIKLIKEYVHNENLIKHMLAVGAIMKRLAKKLNENENEWEICGILHDIDYEKTKDKPEIHGIKSSEMLKDKVNEEILHAIKAHNYEYTNVMPKSNLDIALISADTISGLIIATALIMPNKKLEEVKVKSVKKKFKQKDFAKNINRNKIRLCEKLGLDLNEFIEISLNSLKEIHEELGL